MRLNDDGKTVAASDLLVPGIGELVGGSQREERMEVLIKRMQECGLNPEDYKSYVDLRKYGGVVHSGFGLGFERMIMYLTGTQALEHSRMTERQRNQVLEVAYRSRLVFAFAVLQVEHILLHFATAFTR